jgi:hypothetical protein
LTVTLLTDRREGEASGETVDIAFRNGVPTKRRDGAASIEIGPAIFGVPSARRVGAKLMPSVTVPPVIATLLTLRLEAALSGPMPGTVM